MFFSLAPQEENICSCTPRDLEGERQPTPVLLPGEPQGRGSLAGHSPWGRTESDMTEHLSAYPGIKILNFFFLSFFFSSVFLSTLDCCAISFPFPLLSIPGEGNLRKCTIKWLEGRWTKIQAEFERAGALMG